jgi:diguanylate cyclase (GGDEF)-like protein/PAS domain S-box-containing protein
MNAAWITVGVVAAAGAAAILLRRSRQDVACRWLAAVAALWGLAFAVQGASAGSVMPTGIQLTPSDLVGLVGLPVLVVAMVRLVPPGSRSAPAGLATKILDGCLLGLALFAIGWVTLLRSAYAAAGVGPGSFVVDLIHPVADLSVLGGTLWLAVRAGSRGVAPYLAFAAWTVGDLLAVQARTVGQHPGSLSQLAWLLAICLISLCGVPAVAESARAAAPGLDEGVDQPLSAAIATVAAGVSALVTLIFAVVDWGRFGPGPLLVAALVMLALVARVIALLRRVNVSAAAARRAGRQFLQLAERTSDMVLLCDATGLVRYASKAVGQYGYEPARLTGRSLPDLVHPDDLAPLLQAASSVLHGGPVPATGQACRVRSADGTWRHVEAVMSRYAEGSTPDGGTGQDLVLITAKDVSGQVALRRQVTHLTFHDGVTGLPNRAYLEERAKDLLDREPEGSGSRLTGAVFVDLDGFSAINDSIGHGAGDVLLAQAGRLLRSLVPAHYTVARWSGDGFAVLVEDAASRQEIVDIAERIANSVATEAFSVAGRDMSLTASVGVAFTDVSTPSALDESAVDHGSGPAPRDPARAGPADGDNAVPEHLLRNADLAMSLAKEAGGGRVEVFAAHMYTDVTRRLELATDLRSAIADGALGIEYQPVVELGTSRVNSVEALVRWWRMGEPVSTAEFLGVAEDSGLIIPLGDWVLREACRQAARWRDTDWPVKVSVNLSFRQVNSPELAESVLAALDETGLPPGALTLEVPERVLIEAGAPVIESLTQLRQRGIRLAIDDFGTGYASLAYLRRLPVDIIKVDPSFVAGLGTDAIVAMLTRTIVQVGDDLGIDIVAEGIERPGQLDALRAMGCRLGQGYLLARPMAADLVYEHANADSKWSTGPADGADEVATAGGL